MAADELTPHEENSLLRIADGADAQDDVEEAAVSRLQSLALVEQRGVSFGLTLMGVRKVAQLKQLSVSLRPWPSPRRPSLGPRAARSRPVACCVSTTPPAIHARHSPRDAQCPHRRQASQRWPAPRDPSPSPWRWIEPISLSACPFCQGDLGAIG